MALEVKQSDIKEKVNVPANKEELEDVLSKVKKHLERFANDASKQFDLPLEEVMKCLPTNIELPSTTDTVKTKKSKTSKNKDAVKENKLSKQKITLDNWMSVENKDELKSLKTDDLKNVLSEKGLGITGSKSVLIDRVWNILHPETVEKTETKKKGRKPGSKNKNKVIKDNTSLVEDSDNEDTKVDIELVKTNSLEYILENNSTKIYVNSTNNKWSKKSKGTDEIECLLIPSKGWVFKNNEDSMEFLGLIKGGMAGCPKVEECSAPQELLDMVASV